MNQKLQGYYAYFGITGKYGWLRRYWFSVQDIWRKWLGRRCRRGGLSWQVFGLLQQVYPLRKPRLVRSVYRK